MLSLSNREQLLREAELIPLIEEIASCISPGIGVRAIMQGDRALGELPDWIVYADAQNCGVAIYPYEVVPAVTLLRRRITFASHAHKLARWLASHQGAFPLYLRESGICPAEWHLFKVALTNGDLLCAASFPGPEAVLGGARRALTARRATITLHGHVEWSGGLSIGSSVVVRHISAACVDQEIFGYFGVSEEGVMTFTSSTTEQSDNGITQASVRVRLDIGDIELTLPEVAALRVGSKLELEGALPMRCYLRIGTTTLGVGEIARAEAGLRITLTEIIS